MGGVVRPAPVHAYDATVRPQAAALPVAFSATGCPALTLAGVVTAAIGRAAALTAPSALAMPAPQVSVVQLHSLGWRSVWLAGT